MFTLADIRKMWLIYNFNTLYKKLNQIIEYIEQINTLNHNSQCRYIKKKLLSHDTHDICNITFLKKLHVILHKIPGYLPQLEKKIGDKDFFLFNFWNF